MGRIFFMSLIGAIAGLLAWLITAPLAPMEGVRIDKSHKTEQGQKQIELQNPDPNGPPIKLPADFDPNAKEPEKKEDPARERNFAEEFARYEGSFILALGAFIGLAIGAGYGAYQGSKIHAIRGGVIGMFVGAVGALMGYRLSCGLVVAMFPADVFRGGTSIITTIIARTIVITPIGALLGAVMGIPAKSMKQAVVGLTGGAIAGAIGGATFDMVSQAMGSFMMTVSNNSEIGGPGRALSAVIIGLGIGLFTSLLQTATKSAWVRRIYGRNEFKEWVVDAPQTSIGRNETCHIPIHGDPSVAPIHAMIQKHQGNFFLADCGSGMPTYLNGQPIQQVPLFSGAIIQIGSAQLEFVLKAGSAPQRASEQYRSQYAAAPQQAAPVGYAAQQPMQTPYNPAPQQTMQAPYNPGQQTMQAPYNPAPQPMQPSNPTTVQQPYMGQAAPSMMPQSSTLVATTGPLSGQRFPITGPIELGRDCPSIPLSFDTMVSRRHVSLTPGAGGVMVSDLGSTNGTFVNDQRITNATLKPGDVFRVGSTSFRVEQP